MNCDIKLMFKKFSRYVGITLDALTLALYQNVCQHDLSDLNFNSLVRTLQQ